MFDTHCHLNFEVFALDIETILNNARQAGVTHIVIPGTDIPSSKKAIEIAKKHPHTYAAVGIHPHHVFKQLDKELHADTSIKELIPLVTLPSVIAIGEVGLDRHMYNNTRYKDYHTSEEFVLLQKKILTNQIKIAIKYNKSLIIHNREATDDLIPLLSSNWHSVLEGRTVLHCCEPKDDLLKLAIQKHLFIGVDGDITYDRHKQEFIKHVPLELLVVETDSPFLIPEPYRSQKIRPNTPAYLKEIIVCIAELLNRPPQEIQNITFANAMELFNL